MVRTRAEAAAGAREPLLVLEPLLGFLDAHGLGEGEPEIEPIGDGHSNVTYALRRGDAELVVRRPPRGPLPPSAHDVLREARVLRALEGRAPVPRVLAVCDDERLIGAPFYVMERLEGDVVTDAVPAPLDSEDGRRRMGEELVDALVTLHGVDWRAAGPRGLRQAGGLPRAPAQALRRALGAQPHARAAGGRARRPLAGGAPARVAAGDDRARRLPARQRDVRARRAGARRGDLRLGDVHDRRPARGPRLPVHVLGLARRPARRDLRAARGHARARLPLARGARRPLRGALRAAR